MIWFVKKEVACFVEKELNNKKTLKEKIEVLTNAVSKDWAVVSSKKDTLVERNLFLRKYRHNSNWVKYVYLPPRIVNGKKHQESLTKMIRSNSLF